MTARVILSRQTFRSDELRRAVATLECVNCGRHGFTQAAHSNIGKGMGKKASDAAIMALCGPGPGFMGCHSMLDQGGAMAKEERRAWEYEMIARTYVRLMEKGVLMLVK